jgi:SNF2 family DNA or RNA helicase
MTDASLSTPGTLIHARGREWVVLPESSDEMLLLRPVGGLDEEIAGLLPAVEDVRSATFRLPSKDDLGDFASGRLLRDAARLSTRAAAGPFRSFGRIAAEPRPYQLVPLMMALKLDPVRMLVADDVGIGKTIEAALIARELLDRGEIRRVAVLCPPHLAEQWQRELAEKFHIDAELVLSSTIQRLERDLPLGVSVFDRHRFTVVSTDFIKSTRHAEDFARRCPEFVIVDEAHGCTLAGGVGKGRQQRFELLRRVTADPARHLVLVTATPHSGNEVAFRSLLTEVQQFGAVSRIVG